ELQAGPRHAPLSVDVATRRVVLAGRGSRDDREVATVRMAEGSSDRRPLRILRGEAKRCGVNVRRPEDGDVERRVKEDDPAVHGLVAKGYPNGAASRDDMRVGDDVPVADHEPGSGQNGVAGDGRNAGCAGLGRLGDGASL